MKISIIIMTYNHELYISTAINSVLMQQINDEYEIIISDDASLDSTREIIDSWAARYPHLIKNISGGPNIGISGNVKKCLREVHGEYVCFLEGDDYWIDPFKLASQAKYMDIHPDCPMCFSGARILYEAEMQVREPPRQHELPESFGMELLARIDNPMITFSAICYRRRALDELPSYLFKGRISETALAFYLANFGPIGFIRSKQIVYRHHADSAWNSLSRADNIHGFINTYKAAQQAAPWPYKIELQKIIDKYQQMLIDAKSVE